jgi:hypothetical protein
MSGLFSSAPLPLCFVVVAAAPISPAEAVSKRRIVQDMHPQKKSSSSHLLGDMQ